MQAPRLQQQLQASKRFGGSHAAPKVDSSLDAVFGDSKHKLGYNFEPMPMGSLFVRSLVITGVFMFPVWIFLYDEAKYEDFQAKVTAAKAAKEA